MRRYGAEVFFVEGAITHSDRSSQEKAARGFPKVVMDNLLIGMSVCVISVCVCVCDFAWCVWYVRVCVCVFHCSRSAV